MTIAVVGQTYRVWSFNQSIGVGTHLSWLDAGYTNEAIVEASIAYLGATHVRDGIPISWDLAEYEAIAKAGVKFDIVSSSPVAIASDLTAINQLEGAVPGSIAAVEGVNEYNLNSIAYAGVNSYSNPAWIQLYGPALYAAVKADSALAGVPVIAASMGGAGAAQVAQEGKVAAFANSSNWHEYFGNGDQPAAGLAGAVAEAETTDPGGPVTITETGYYTAIAAMQWGGGGVSPPVQAILIVNDLLDAFKDGVQTTYLYELMDEDTNPSTTDLYGSFGLFYANGTPKPAATAIHDLTTILADSGANAATFQTGTLNATITNLPTTGNDMVFEKSSGAYDIVVWNEPTVWNEATESQVTPAAVAITVNLGATYGYVQVFDPLVSATAIESFTNVASITLALSADPYIIEIEPYTAPHTYSPGAAGGTIDSTGPDTIIMGAGAVTVNATGPTIAITGGPGALTYTGTARATITGGTGAMTITLSGTGSTVTAGAGGMTLVDLVGGNIINGDAAGNAQAGITVTTTTGNDTITTGGWPASNTINLGAGNDTVIVNGATNVTGSTGNDTITVNDGWGTIITGTGSSVVTMKVSGVVTTNGRDTVSTNAPLTLTANGPATTVSTGAGYVWFGGDGGATITAGAGGGCFTMTDITDAAITTAIGASDSIILGAAGGTIVSQGNDHVVLGSGAAKITATGTIAITGGTGALTYSGSAYATITGGSGAMNVNLTGGAGATVNTGSGGAQITTAGWPGTDILNLGSGADTVTINGSTNLFGSTGNDTIIVQGGWDSIVTGTGTSTLTLKVTETVTTNGHDTVIASQGLYITADGPSTTITGGTGQLWFGGDGSATITGGSGGGYFDLTKTTSSVLTTATGATDSIELGAAGGTIYAHGADYITLGTGNASISALAGTDTLNANSGQMTFIEGAASATVNAGSGQESFLLTKGMAGGSLTINDFVPGSDTIQLVGYGSSGLNLSVVGGSTEIRLSDSSLITLTNFSNASWHPTLQN